jgi:PEP-CTERM motif
MKRLFFIATASLACISAFAQGKVWFGNDTAHLVYYNPAVFGAPLGGAPVYPGNFPPGVNFAADLYLGTASSSLSLTMTTAFGIGGAPGEWTPVEVSVPGLSPGTTVFVKIQVRDVAFAPESLWTPGFLPPTVNWGFSVEFPFVLPSFITPPGWGNAWPPGDFPMSGGLGAIPVGYVPEPSAVALAGFGAVLLLLRKPLISKDFKAFQTKN